MLAVGYQVSLLACVGVISLRIMMDPCKYFLWFFLGICLLVCLFLLSFHPALKDMLTVRKCNQHLKGLPVCSQLIYAIISVSLFLITQFWQFCITAHSWLQIDLKMNDEYFRWIL